MTTNTESIAKRMDLMRQTAISEPMRNCMNSIATRPPTVVRELELISGMLLLRDSMTASFRGMVWCASLKWLQKMMA